MEENIIQGLSDKEKEKREKAWDFIKVINEIDPSTPGSFDIGRGLSELLFHAGEPELAKRWARVFLKKCIDTTRSSEYKHQWSHELTSATQDLYSAKDELLQNLYYTLARLYELGGGSRSFGTAFGYYEGCEELFPGKLPDKSKLIRIDKGNYQYDYPNYHEVKDKEEHDKMVKEILEEYYRSVPDDVMNMDMEDEVRSIAGEINKLVKEKGI